MGGGKKSPLLSCIEANPFLLDVFMDYRNQKKMLNLGQTLKTPLQFWNFLGLNNPFFWLNLIFGYHILLKMAYSGNIFKGCPKETANGHN